MPRIDTDASVPTPARRDDPGRPWTWSSGSFRALDLEFDIRTEDPRLGRYLDAVLLAQRTDRPASTAFCIVGGGGVGGAGSGWQIIVDERPSHRVSRASEVVPALFAEINESVVHASSARHVLFHASGAASGDRCAIFPGTSGSGKTTLVAGLVLAGLSYVTDEAVALDVESRLVQPFPKPLSIERGSWTVLESLRPTLDEDLRDWAADQWHIDPLSVRENAVAAPSRPAFVVPVRYAEGERTTLRAIHRADAVTSLMNNAFETNRKGRTMFNAVSAMVREAECFELVVSDLKVACELVRALFE